LLVLTAHAVQAQKDSLAVEHDWQKSYNTGGIQQGGFLNVNRDNFFGRGLTGVYLGFHKNDLYVNLEMDFLFGGYRKFFKQFSQPGGQFSVSWTFFTWKKLEVQAGMATAFRSGMVQYARVKELIDTLNMDFTGTSSTLSRGVVLRGTWKLGGERNKLFSEVGIQLTYMFDMYAHGYVYQPHGPQVYSGSIPAKYRLQRDSFTLQIRLGLGQYTRKKEAPKIDPELQIEEI
jgi:hypothetical protein